MRLFFAVLAAAFLARAFAFGYYFDIADCPRNFADKPFIYFPEDALRAYAGKWDGAQLVKMPTGRTIAAFVVVQNYEKNLDGSLDCVLEAFSSDSKVAEKKSRIYIEEDLLVLAVQNEGGKYVPEYVGGTKSGKVVWSPYYSFFSYDVQADDFRRAASRTVMRSEGCKFEKLPQIGYKGMIFSEGEFYRLAPKKTVAPKDLSLDKKYFSK